MFSDKLLNEIFCDERMHSVPIGYQSAVLNAVQDAMHRRYYTDNTFMTKDEIINEICTGGDPYV